MGRQPKIKLTAKKSVRLGGSFMLDTFGDPLSSEIGLELILKRLSQEVKLRFHSV